MTSIEVKSGSAYVKQSINTAEWPMGFCVKATGTNSYLHFVPIR